MMAKRDKNSEVLQKKATEAKTPPPLSLPEPPPSAKAGAHPSVPTEKKPPEK
jgi:hypothetical protein